MYASYKTFIPLKMTSSPEADVIQYRWLNFTRTGVIYSDCKFSFDAIKTKPRAIHLRYHHLAAP